MLQQIKKPVALICALFLCVSMLTGIVLPEIAETATAVADPYASVNAQTTLLTVTDGTVTPSDDGATAISVPDEFEGMDIYEPNDKVKFYDPEWTAADLGIEDSVGEYFFARYGDGVEWGNGKVYLLKWRVNAYGAKQYEATTALDGTQLSAAGKYKGWSDMINDLRHTTPVIGADNNWYVVLFPGNMSGSTGSSGNATELEFTAPALTDTVTATSELTAADYTTVNFFGPRAGKSPSTGTVGNTEIANDRGVDKEKEIVFGSTFWSPIDATWKFDGIALSGTCKVARANYTDNHVSGMYIDNAFMNLTSTDSVWCTVGSNNTTSTVATVFHLTNSYYNSNVINSIGNINYIQANDVLFDNVVINGINANDGNGLSWRLLPSFGTSMDTAYLGTYRNDYHAEFVNCTFNYTDIRRVFDVYNDRFGLYDNADILVKNNFFRGFKEQFFYNLTTTKSDGTVLTGYSLALEDNYIEAHEKATETYTLYMLYMRGGYYTDGETTTVDGNTFVATQGTYPVVDVNSTDQLLDLSGNLFMTHDGAVRVPRASYASNEYLKNAKVISDIYASAEKKGGLKDLFTVQETNQDLLITHSHVQTQINSSSDYREIYGTDILGSITILPKNGVTYYTKDLIKYKDEDVTYVGMFSDSMCTTPVTSFKKGFGILYAKAEYETGLSKATIVYVVKEPSDIHIVDPNSVGSYTFNGTTYTTDNATFYTTLSDAYSKATDHSFAIAANAAPNNSTDVVLLMPGSYATFTFSKDIAVVGPMFGVSATKEGSAEVANGRSDDTSKEAVLTAKWVIAGGNYAYITISGVSRQTVANDGYSIVVDTIAAEAISHVNLADLYINTGGVNLVSSPSANQNYNVASANLCPIYINNSYFSGSANTNRNMFVQASYIKFDGCTISAPSGTTEGVYYVPTDPTLNTVSPLTGGWFMEGCTIANGTKRWFNGAYTYVPNGNTLEKGHQASFIGNTFLNMKTDYIVQVSTNETTPAKSVGITFKNNKVWSDASTSAWVISDWTSRSTHERAYLEISGNAIHNYTQPWNLKTGNNADVNENYYGDADCGVMELDTTKGSGYSFDTSWYYVNEACTVKTTDIALLKGGFNGVTIVNGINDYEAKLYATVGQSYGIGNFDAFNADVVGIYSDPAAEKALSSVTLDGSEQVIYVRVSKDNYIATWKVTLCVTDAWTEAGLALQDGDDGYVDLSTTDKYATREGGNAQKFAFIAADWKTWAYTDETLTTLTSADETNLEEGTDGTDWDDTVDNGVVDPRELKIGTVFYAKMPTTGIIYKLTYGVTAFNMRHCNTGNFATVVLFPGFYNKVTGYNSGSSASDYTDTSVSNMYFAVGRGMTGVTEATTVRLLGPQAGINGANVATGGSRRSYVNHSNTDSKAEATLAANGSIYLLNGGLKDGGTITIDGIAGGWGFTITTAPSTGASNLTKVGTANLNVVNCVFDALNGSTGLFALYPSTGAIGTNISKNTAKMFLTLNIENTFIRSNSTTDANASLGRVNTDAIHIKGSVINIKKTAASNPYGFYICPVTGANNSTKHTLSYTCEDSYVNTYKGYLFGIYFNGTEKINADTRDGIEIRLTDNTIVDAGLATGDATRATLFTLFNGAKDDPDIAGLIDLSVTGNTVTNTTGAYPKYGYLFYGIGSTMYRSMDISKNTFTGYNNLYRSMPTDYDYSDNIYLDNNGRYISGRSYNNEIAIPDIVLSADYTKHASDFAIKTGLEVDGGLTWTPGAIDITCNASHVYKTGLTAAEIKEGVTFASDNVQVLDLYNEDGVTVATTLEVGKTYRLVATYKDTPDTARAIYYVTIDEDPANIPLYTGNRQYLDPAVATLTAGSRVVREVDCVKYQFTVGKNVLGSLSEFPLVASTDLNGNSAPDRFVYLFAKEYTAADLNKIGGNNAEKRGMVTHFYGAQTGVSAVTRGSDGIPTGANTARQDSTKETIFRDVTMTTGYQSSVTIDGVMFAGKTYIEDTAAGYGTRVTEFEINNCTTHPDAPLYNTGLYTKIFGFNAGNKSNVTMLNNYFVTSEDMLTGHLYVGRNIQELEFANNVFIPGNADTGCLYLNVSNTNGTYDTATDGMEISVHDNLLGGHVTLDSVKAQNAITNNLKIDVLVQNNRFDLENGTRGFFVQNYTGSDTYGYANFAGTSIEVLDNEFCGGAETDDFVRVEGTRTEGVDNVPFKVFRIAGNTFQHSVDAPVKYAIANFSDTVLDVSQNTFVGFAYNYGDADYMVGSAAADKVVVNASKFAPDLTEENVLFTGVSKATFTIDSTDYASDTDNSATVTVADTASSGLKVVDGTTITDVAVAGAKKNGYLFKPASGMMVKITAGDGTVRYNVLPIDITDKTKAKATFTAQLCTIDGKAVGDEFTVTAYADPISVVMNAANCKVSDTADGQKSLYWEANFKGNHSTYIADLISKSGFTIVEYGMYYANDEIAVSDVAILNGGYVDGKYTDGINILGQKAVYANNPNGLESVYLNYSHSFTAAVPAATEARYGRMYMTYKVGDTLYTVLSDTVTLNIYVAAN